MDAGFRFCKVPTTDVMRDTIKCTVYAITRPFCIEPTTRNQTTLLSNTQVGWIKSWIMEHLPFGNSSERLLSR